MPKDDVQNLLLGVIAAELAVVAGALVVIASKTGPVPGGSGTNQVLPPADTSKKRGSSGSSKGDDD